MSLSILLQVSNLHALALGERDIVSPAPSAGSFSLVTDGRANAAILVDSNDWPGVIRASQDFRSDLVKVTGAMPPVVSSTSATGALVFIGTLGKSSFIDSLVRSGKLDVHDISAKWESTLIELVDKPLPGVEKGLVIAGSDKRGTIYGLYELSEQMGVSPWYWWADVPITHHDSLFVRPGRFVLGPPAVRYRGIFLNDEAPALSGWSKEKFGGFNHAFYTNVFELLLRLRGNFLWPAMWNNSFDTDDPLNPKLADEYGIVMGTSHHEPMMRAWKEWSRAGNPPGSWDYSKNGEKLRQFWTEGLRRNQGYEKILTLGMRGDGDEPMSEKESVSLLERIVGDQRQLVSEIINPRLSQVPQVWALYKEVQGYFERGMRVPDDVTLLWCDDNWGNVRRLPTLAERSRSGGAGIYYHFDYVGGPRNYKWLNTVPLPKVWEQMTLAYFSDARQIWVVNVGDLKPMEIPIEFFLTLAWKPERWSQNDIKPYLEQWATREFGLRHAAEIADLVSKYTKYNGRRKPELLEPDTFSLINYGEADRVLEEWRTLLERAGRVSADLSPASRDAFFELVLHPIKACCQLNELYVAAAKNRLYAGQGRASANVYGSRIRELFQADAELTDYYHHQLAGGKWDKMMSQTHIGYTGWQEPPVNRMPAVTHVDVLPSPALGLAVEGSPLAWTNSTSAAVLPGFDRFGQTNHYFELFNRGTGSATFRAETAQPWILLSVNGGNLSDDQRVYVSIDWDKAPAGRTTNEIRLTGGSGEAMVATVQTFNPIASHVPKSRGFIEADGYVAMEAEHYAEKTDSPVAHWDLLPDHGRLGSAMTVFPATASSVFPPKDSPNLRYDAELFTSGELEVNLILSPSLNYSPDRPVRIGFSADAESPRVLTVVPQGYNAGDGNKDWEETVKDSVRIVKTTASISAPGWHQFRVWMVDPGVVLQRIILNTGGVRKSYLGPPESFRFN